MDQIALRIEAKGVTPIPAPTRTLASNLKTSSEALPKGPSTCKAFIICCHQFERSESTMTRGRTRLIGGVTTAAPAPFEAFSPVFGRSQPRASASARVKSPTTPAIEVSRV